MTWRVYRWDDADAPSLSAASSSLITLLTTVLNGTGTAYGSKTAAGWTATSISSTQSLFTNAWSGHSVLVTHAASTNIARAVGCEGTNYITGPFFPTEAQVSGGLYWAVSSTTDSTARPWMIFADEKRFCLWIGYSQTTASGLATTTGQFMYSAGDIESANPGSDPYPFMVTGGASTGLSAHYFASISSTYSSAVVGHYIARANTGAGTALAVTKLGDYSLSQGAMGASGVPYPSFGGGMILAPIRIAETSNVLRGVMPKVWQPCHPLPGNPGDTFSGTGVLAGKTFILLDVAYNGSLRGRIAMETS